MKKYVLLLAFLLSTLHLVSAQNLPFSGNEKLTYDVSYNMGGGLMTSFGQVTMQTSKVKTKKSTLYHLKCTASTYSKFDSYFKIRDLYESYINPKNLKPLLYKRDTDEGGHKRYEKYTFNHKAKTVKTLYRKRDRETTKDIGLGGETRDLVSTLYYIRSLPVGQAKTGDSKTFKILFDRKEKFVRLTFLGKETLSTALGKKECFKIAVDVTNEKILKGTNKNIMWLSADEHKLPIQIKFNIAVGAGTLKIKTASGLN